MPLLGKKKLSVDESAKTKRWSFGRKKKSSKGDDLSAPPSPLTPTAPTTNTSPFPPASPSPVNQHLNPNPYVLDQPPTPTTLSPPSATQQLSPPPSAGLYPPSSYIAQSRKSSTASGGGSLDGSGDGQAGGYSSPYRQPSPVERTSNSPAPSTSSNLGGYGHAYRKSYSGSPSPSLMTPYDPRQNPYIRHRDNGYNSNTGYTAGTLYGESRDDSFSGAQQNGNGPQQQQLLMRQEEQEAETETSTKPYSPYGVNILSASYEPQNQQSQLLLREEEEEKAKRTTNPYINYNTNRLSARYGTGRYSLDATRYGSSLYNPYGDDAFKRAQEEEEEEDVEAIKQEIRFVKQETVSSTRNAIRAGMMAEEAGRDTLMRLGQQGERLADAEKNLDLAHSKNRTAADQAREIKTLNRSMFAVHVKNPFNSKERQEERERTILERHDADMAAREATRAFGYQSSQTARLATKNNPMATTTASSAYRARMSLAEKAKYQFEPDESDEEKEREIEENLGQIGQIAGRLKDLAVTTGQELDRQNEQIGKIAGKNDKISRDVVLNTARLNRIAK